MMTSSVTSVDFFFDPVCPFAWIGSQWIREVARQRAVNLRFRLMSLAVLNEDPADPYERAKGLDSAWRPVRVGAALREARGEEILDDFLAEFGQRFHVLGVRGRDRVIRDTLDALGAPELYSAADDHMWDEAVRKSHHEALAPIGEGAGTPALHVDGAAIFGPIFSEAPRGVEALEVFDAVTRLMHNRSFFELKRAVQLPLATS